MQASSSATSRRENYAQTIVWPVIQWYTELGRMLTTVDAMRGSAARRGSFEPGEYVELVDTLMEAKANLFGFSESFMLPTDKENILTYDEAERLVPAMKRGPMSRYGNQVVFEEALRQITEAELALWTQFKSIKKIMIERKWFDLKPSWESYTPSKPVK